MGSYTGGGGKVWLEGEYNKRDGAIIGKLSTIFVRSALLVVVEGWGKGVKESVW